MTKWYAVQRNDDDDWGWGSFDWDEAVKMLKDQGYGLIAMTQRFASKRHTTRISSNDYMGQSFCP